MCKNSNSDEYLRFEIMCISYVHAVLPHGKLSIVYLLEGQLQQVCLCLSLFYCGARTCVWSGAIEELSCTTSHVVISVAIPKSAC